MQGGGVEVGDVVAFLRGVKAERIGGTVSEAALDAAAGHHDGEPVRVMIAAGTHLALEQIHTGRAAEFRAEHDHRFIEHAALLEVLNETAMGWSICLQSRVWLVFRLVWESHAPALHDNPVSVLVTHHGLHSFAPVLSDHQVYLPHDAVVPGLLSSMDLPGLRSVVERPGLAGFEMGRPINYFGQLMKDSPNHPAFWLAFRLKE